MNTEIKNALIAADAEAQYDEKVKRLLGNKIILAHILVKTVDEFWGMDLNEVVSYIESDPFISVVPVEPGLTNAVTTTFVGDKKDGQRLVGMNTENAEVEEGLVRFDIIFYVRMKDGVSQVIVNLEAQKDDPGGYDLLNRAVFYVSRMVSSQNIPVDDRMREDVSAMCNLSQGVLARGEARGEAQGKAIGEAGIILRMYKNGYSVQQIADATDKNVDEVETIVETGEPVLA